MKSENFNEYIDFASNNEGKIKNFATHTDVWKSGNVIFPSFPSLRLPLGMFPFMHQKEQVISLAKSFTPSNTFPDSSLAGWGFRQAALSNSSFHILVLVFIVVFSFSPPASSWHVPFYNLKGTCQTPLTLYLLSPFIPLSFSPFLPFYSQFCLLLACSFLSPKGNMPNFCAKDKKMHICKSMVHFLMKQSEKVKNVICLQVFQLCRVRWAARLILVRHL